MHNYVLIYVIKIQAHNWASLNFAALNFTTFCWFTIKNHPTEYIMISESVSIH